MKIILYSDIPNLGEEGEIKVVADGYARNYLLPRKLAVRYTKMMANELAQKQQSITRRKTEKVKTATGDKEKIESLVMNLSVMAGEKGKLFGSVTSSAVMEYLQSQGIAIERKRIELPDSGIKVVGAHTVTVKLYGGEKAMLNINVSAIGEESGSAYIQEKVAEIEDKADMEKIIPNPTVKSSAVIASSEG